MSLFTAAEIEYMGSQALGRLATVGPDGQPHITPVGIFYDPDDHSLVIGGHAGTEMAASKKFRDAHRNPTVAIVIDDVVSTDPWTPRYIEVRGHAEAHRDGGEDVGKRIASTFPFDPAWIRVVPRRIVTYGIEMIDELAARDVA